MSFLFLVTVVLFLVCSRCFFGEFFKLRDRVLGVKLRGRSLRSPRLLKPVLRVAGWLSLFCVDVTDGAQAVQCFAGDKR